MNNNQKSSFVDTKFVTENGFRSVFPTNWPNLFPAYTLSYSAATGKPIQNGKKKLFILLILLLLLITSLAASLILAYLWFNAIATTDYTNQSIKMTNHDSLISSNNHQHKIIKDTQINKINEQIKQHQLEEQKRLNDENRLKEKLRLDEENRLKEQIKLEESNRLKEQIRLEEANRLKEQIRLNEENRLKEQIRLNEENRLKEQLNENRNNEQFNRQINLNKNQATSTTKLTTTSSTPQTITVETNDEDGFGEKENDNHFVNTQSIPINDQSNKDDEQLINFYKNFKNELDRKNKKHHEEKYDGDYVEHHTLSSDLVEDDSFNGDSLTSNLSPSNQPQFNNQPQFISTENHPNIQSTSIDNLNLPESLQNLKAKQFCNLNQYTNTFRNASYECKTELNQNLISSYFCNDKFVILAKVKSLRETTITQQDINERQLVSKYDVQIERILKRSPFLSVVFKKQGLTTNITINLAVLEDELRNLESNTITCLGTRLELKLGQTYLVSGRIFGLNAVSSNCDVILEWFEDLDEEQRNALINWSTNRTTFSHC